MSALHLLKNLYREISGANGPKERSALIAAEGDEMKITLADKAFESLGHGDNEGEREAHPLQKPQRVGHPRACSMIHNRYY